MTRAAKREVNTPLTCFFNLITFIMLNRKTMKAASFPTSEIKVFKAKGWSNDAIYNRAAGVLGLYGVAFFGHKGTKVQKQKLNRTWKRILAAK